MQRGWRSVILCGVGSVLFACGNLSSLGSGSGTSEGSTDPGMSSSETRAVTGSVPTSLSSTSLAAKSVEAGSTCSADTVIATDTGGATVSAAVDASCAFSIDLAVGTSYVLSLANEGTFVATLLFNGSAEGFSSSTLTIGDGDGSIELGALTISGTVATAAQDPSEQNDADGDGTADASDSDADGDGTDDVEESDCSCSTEDAGEGASRANRCDMDDDEDDGVHVLRVRPWSGRQHVALNKRVRALVKCRLDRDSVNEDTFRIVSEDGDEIHCAFRFVRFGPWALERITCRHYEDLFEPGTRYTATLDGVMCRDGRPVETRTWSWRTRDPEAFIEAFLDGDEEDQLDLLAEDEVEGDEAESE